MNNRFCRQPWSFVEVHQNGDIWNCCPSWITKPMGNILEQSWEEVGTETSHKNIDNL